MKFSISQAALQDLLQVVVSAVPTKSTLPILSNILVEADREGLTMVSTDLDLSIKTRGEAQVDREGSITIPAKRIGEIVRELKPDTEIKVSVSGTKVKMNYGHGSSTIIGLDPEDFPQLPQIDAEKMVSLPTDVFERAVKRSAYAVSSDETRQMLTGVLFQLQGNMLNLVSTDGHRLAKAAFQGDFKGLEGRDLIIPPKALNQVVRLASGNPKVNLTVSRNFAVFEVGTTTVFSRLIDGNFPNYEQVIPKENPHRFHLDKEEFMGAIRRVSVLSDHVTRQIKLALKPERVELSVSTADVGEGQEALPVDYTGSEIAVGYNASYLLEALRTIPSNKIEMRLNTPTSPGILVPAEQEKEEDLLCLVMPLRLPDA
ncbi:MAG: DNA polymerase III subunit beta [Candidatus Eisenbacteria bacterium]|uniref:Beta sliding clamp n=1 Tax=Eiseniibacteriota bacterium TaxID=2212470 RepID=A0A7Y2EEW7_UNCEI|nr:DNA polymerase III subunit beta [Candidatus Eisenbacteria bacterium]